MSQSPQFYTATMAKLYADQGYLRKAAEIYRYLAAQHPDRDDLQKALEEIERQIADQPAPTRKDTELLLREWIDLLKHIKRQKRRERNRPLDH